MSNYLRVSIQGALPGDEKWSVNPVFAPLMPPFTATEDQLITVAQAIAGLTVPSALIGLLSTSATVASVRVEARDASFALQTVGEFARVTPLAGSGTLSKPNQCAIVLSLRTAGVGARSRGRMYWPALVCSTSGTTGRLSSPAPASIASDASAYLKLISNAIGATLTGVDTWSPVVFSRVNNSSRIVNGVWVGDVLDTQRRRRDTLPDNYSRVVYPLP